jgi:hypothetical protein
MSPGGPRASMAAGEHGQPALVELSLHCAPARSHLLVVLPASEQGAAAPRGRRRR